LVTRQFLKAVNLDYWERTVVSFGKAEAYARRRRRLVPIVGTSVHLCLEEQSEIRAASSPLLQLTEGALPSIERLSNLLPSLGSVTWAFDEITSELVTNADGIRISLMNTNPGGEDTLTIEGALRGIAARLVVAITYAR
jgi:hypothetical protein